MVFNNPLLNNYPLLEAISTDSFVGQDARYMESFEAVEKAVSSSSSLFSGAAIDWGNVVELSSKVLTTQTKDVRVLAWFSWGLFKVHSFEGLHAGLFIINELLAKCWDEIFPVKKRSRIAAFEWLTSRIEQLFMDETPSIGSKELHQAFLAELKRLDEVLTAQWGEESPLLLPTCRRIEKTLSDETAGQNVQEPNAENAVEKVALHAQDLVTGTASSSLSLVSSVGNDRDANKLLRTLQDNGRSLCLWWLSQHSSDIKALRLNRTLLWITIENLPDNKEGVTALRPVPVDKVNNYRERLNQGRYNDLINDIEMSISKAPFWLDGQHMVWQCMKALRADDAMLEIEVQLALFLNRIPDLVNLKFHDGTPFANEQTLAWINDNVLPKLKTTASQLSAMSVSEGSVNAKWDVALQEAMDNLSANGLKDSMATLVAGLNMAEGGREKFFWRLCMAKLCLANNRYELAKTQLENLDECAVQLNISEWEPSLALEIVCLLYRCCELLPQSQSIREDKEGLYKRLCFLNMSLIMDEK